MLVALSITVVVLAVLAIVGWVHYQTERDSNKRLLKDLARTRVIPYAQASLEDRFAERAMQSLLENGRFAPGALDMNLEKLTDEAYRIAQFMMQARAFKKRAF